MGGNSWAYNAKHSWSSYADEQVLKCFGSCSCEKLPKRKVLRNELWNFILCALRHECAADAGSPNHCCKVKIIWGHVNVAFMSEPACLFYWERRAVLVDRIMPDTMQCSAVKVFTCREHLTQIRSFQQPASGVSTPVHGAMFEPTGWKPNQRFACCWDVCIFVGWGGVGWDNNVHATLLPCFFCTVPQTSCDAAAMFSCTVPHTSCYAAAMFSCTVPHTSCYAAAMLSCAVAHTSCYAAALFPCTVPHTSCYAAAMFSCAVAVVHTSCYAAALFPCTVAHTSCYAAAMFWKPKMPKIQTAWIKRFGSMFECSSSGAGKTQIAATWASSPPPRTWSTLCEEKNARRCCFIQNHFKMGSQNFKKFLTSKHMKMT